MIGKDSVSSEKITINAPAEVVWSVIVDFENYHLWNDFCPQISGELEESLPGWKAVVGPQEAADIESFVKAKLSA